MTRSEELAVKLERVREWLADTDLHGVALRTRANFAWFTCGGRSDVSRASDVGVATVFISADRLVLASNNIELERLAVEELGAELDAFELAEFPWYDPDGEAGVLASLSGGKPIGVDAGQGGQPIAARINALRNPLTAAEIDRYRALGALASETTESVCRQIRSGMSEHDVTAMIHEAFERQGVRVPVNLVAADERIDLRRHPIVKGQPINQRVMAVVCAERHGLIVSLTRLVHFEPLDGELKIRHRAVCQVDAAAIVATRPGRRLCDVFKVIQDEYDRQGFDGEWQLHHQGGPTGYLGRDAFANPTSDVPVVTDQAYAWNPSITGTKSEDTILVTDSGFEMISEPGSDWPTVGIERERAHLQRADILVAG